MLHSGVEQQLWIRVVLHSGVEQQREYTTWLVCMILLLIAVHARVSWCCSLREKTADEQGRFALFDAELVRTYTRTVSMCVDRDCKQRLTSVPSARQPH